MGSFFRFTEIVSFTQKRRSSHDGDVIIVLKNALIFEISARLLFKAKSAKIFPK